MKHNTIKLHIGIIAMALSLPVMLQAQTPRRTLVGEWREGDYIVRRYITEDKTPHSDEYEVFFAINSADANINFENNDKEIAAMDALFLNIKGDTLKHITSIAIEGIASPDGTVAHNSTLARQRAQHLATMIAKRYNLPTNEIAITSHVEPWSATTDALEHSKLNNRNDLIRIVNTDEAPMVVDKRLKREDEAWQYLKEDVLPDMRRAIVTVTYTADRSSESREYSPPKPEVIAVVDEYIVEERPRHHGKHRRHKVVVVNEWEGVIIDLGGETEGYAAE